MNNKITAQVVMLPTKKSRLSNRNGELNWACPGGMYTGNHNPQHIYFTTDEPIQEGDWYTWKDGTIRMSTRDNKPRPDCNGYKVVASTDPALGLSAIPAAWIRDVYVPSNGSIKEVKLELITGYFILSTNNEPDKWVEFNKPRLRHINSEVVIVDEPTEEPIDPTYRHYKFDEPQDTRILDNIVPQIANGTFNIDQELEDAAEKASLRIYAYESEPRINRDAKIGFIDGAEWQKEQSAKHAIRFSRWISDNGYFAYTDNKWVHVPAGSKYSDQEVHNMITDKELYELWKQTKTQ